MGSTASFEIAFDGEALQGHSMDVQQLAPALLALGDLIREANTQLNGDRSKVRVLVQSDFEHKCFNVSLDIIQTVLEHIKTLLQDDSIKSAKDLLEWLGLIVGAPAASVLAYLQLRR